MEIPFVLLTMSGYFKVISYFFFFLEFNIGMVFYNISPLFNLFVVMFCGVQDFPARMKFSFLFRCLYILSQQREPDMKNASDVA